MNIVNKKINKVLGATLSNKMSGFTIIETLVAIFILSISITSFLGLVSQSILTARYAKNEITANYLAQEVADYIRNQRDSIVFLQIDNWENFLQRFGNNTAGLESDCYKTNGCYWNFDNNETNIIVPECPQGKCPVVKINGVDSNFKRKILMTMKSNDEIHIHIIVEWLNGNSTKTKELRFSLTNWMNY